MHSSIAVIMERALADLYRAAALLTGPDRDAADAFIEDALRTWDDLNDSGLLLVADD